jgi:hypothetical protein
LVQDQIGKPGRPQRVAHAKRAVDESDILHSHWTTVIHDVHVFKHNVFPKNTIELLRYISDDELSDHWQWGSFEWWFLICTGYRLSLKGSCSEDW